MFDPKKVIPALAAGVLALTGCGGSDDGTGGAAGSGGTAGSGGSAGAGGTAGSGGTAGTGGIGGDLGNALNAFCMKLVECFPEYYMNTPTCVSDITEYYGIIGEISPACEAAAASYFDCGSMLTCDQLDLISNDCDDEFNAAADACN